MSNRLFFALWPDDSIRARIAARMPEWSAGLEGRWQRPEQWHVTLEFIGEVPAGRVAALQRVAQDLPVPAVEIAFDRLEHWPGPQVACLVSTPVPAALSQFVERLRVGLTQAGFTPEARPFRAHVTLARKVKAMHAMPVVPPLRWPAAGFALVRSVTDPAGSRYEPIACWNGAVQNS